MGLLLNCKRKGSEKYKQIINFSSSGFVVDGCVVSCTRYLDLILGDGEVSQLMVDKKLNGPKSNASFYFNHSDAWVPLCLSKVLVLPDFGPFESSVPYYLLYFTSHLPLPSPLNTPQALTSPLGLLSIPLYLNQSSDTYSCLPLPFNSDLIPFPHFPGAEGSYYNGKMLIPSKYKGFCIAFNLPKI